MRCKIVAILIPLLAVFSAFWTAGTAGAGNWEQTLSERFDVVETFDDLQDWPKDPYALSPGGGYAFENPDDFPKESDGTSSMWCYFTKYDEANSALPWIGNFGPETHFATKGKTAVIDLSNKRGPSRLGTYFGDGNPNSGYSDLYFFHMAYITPNQWPTECEGGCVGGGGLGTYEEGKDYAYYAVWKFHNIGSGWNNCGKWKGSKPSHDDRYGDSEVIPHIGIFNYGPIPTLDGSAVKQNQILTLSVSRVPQDASRYSYDSETVQVVTDRSDYVAFLGKGVAYPGGGQWVGFEFHYKMESPAGAGNGVAEAWIYNQKGEYKRAYRFEGLNFLDPDVGPNHKFNRFFFGGNNSNSYTWGPTMQAPYYVDDLVIDDQRIGPTYFKLLGGEEVPSPPSQLKVIQN
jgi:hypothetical protein